MTKSDEADMPPRMRSPGRLLIEFAILVVFISPQATAQAVRQHIRLPFSYGATPISAQINAQANYLAAAGDFLESAANARLTNAQAANAEMENSINWVRTYFERKKLNRSYTKKPNYIESERATSLMIENVLLFNPDIAVKEDVTDKLNWMLHQLNALAPAESFIANGPNTFVGAPHDAKLSQDDIHQVQFTDGGRANGQLLVFRADAKEALDTHWPRALRIPELDDVRHRFEWIRDDSVKEIRDGRDLSDQSAQKLMASVDALCDSFIAAYPPQRRTESMSEYASYLTGKKFVQSLALAVCRAIEAEDKRAFDGSYQFHGDRVAELVGHMHNFGLEFASPPAGGEGVYRKIFFAMRGFFQVANANKPNAP